MRLRWRTTDTAPPDHEGARFTSRASTERLEQFDGKIESAKVADILLSF